MYNKGYDFASEARTDVTTFLPDRLYGEGRWNSDESLLTSNFAIPILIQLFRRHDYTLESDLDLETR